MNLSNPIQFVFWALFLIQMTLSTEKANDDFFTISCETETFPTKNSCCFFTCSISQEKTNKLKKSYCFFEIEDDYAFQTTEDYTFQNIQNGTLQKILIFLNLKEMHFLSQTCKILHEKYKMQLKNFKFLCYLNECLKLIFQYSEPTFEIFPFNSLSSENKYIGIPHFVNFVLKFLQYRYPQVDREDVSFQMKISPKNFSILDSKQLAKDTMERVKDDKKSFWLQNILYKFQQKDFIFYETELIQIFWKGTYFSALLLFKQIAFMVTGFGTNRLMTSLSLSEKFQFTHIPKLGNFIYSEVNQIFFQISINHFLEGPKKALWFPTINVKNYFDGYKFDLKSEMGMKIVPQEETDFLFKKYKSEESWLFCFEEDCTDDQIKAIFEPLALVFEAESLIFFRDAFQGNSSHSFKYILRF